VLFGAKEHEPRNRKLGDRVAEHRAPTTKHLGPTSLAEREGQKDQRRRNRPREHEEGGRQLAHRDSDQEIRNSPDDSDRYEEQRPPSRHGYDRTATPARAEPGLREEEFRTLWSGYAVSATGWWCGRKMIFW
jgi:hypothetical protein